MTTPRAIEVMAQSMRAWADTIKRATACDTIAITPYVEAGEGRPLELVLVASWSKPAPGHLTVNIDPAARCCAEARRAIAAVLEARGVISGGGSRRSA